MTNARGGGIVDTHLHIWDPAMIDYGWLGPAAGELYRRFDVEGARSAAAGLGIEGAILVQAADNVAESRYLAQAAGRSDWILGVVGWLPLRSPERTRRLLADPGAPAMVGIRHLTHDDPDPELLLDPPVLTALRVVADAGLTLDVPDSYPRQLAQVPTVARAVPGLRIIVDHLGKPPVGGDLTHWRTLIADAAAEPNVFAKVSGLGTSLADGRQWNQESLRPVLDHALAVFGADRLMFGSDWPIAAPAGDYRFNAAVILEAVGGLSAAEQSAIRSRTARRVYGLAATA